MTEDLGLRERKRRATRRALAEAAVRLFDRQGYEGTTVAEIAAAADVSTKTFFNYFPAKEDVLFINPQRRVDAALAVIAARHGEPLADVLVAAVEQMLWYTERDDLATGMAATRLHLISTVPALQAAALRRTASAAVQLTNAVYDAYQPELDEDTAAAAVGALLGAVIGVTNAGLQRGDPPRKLAAAVRRAAAIAVRGMQ